MDEYLLSYREVIPDQTNSEEYKEIKLNTGGTHSILQDIKVPERAGGYAYHDASKIHNRNRFIYWRTSHDTLELSEVSLDYNLTDNCIRYIFADSPILSVGIFEDKKELIILIITVCSLHRLTFPHPDSHNRDNDVKNLSIFVTASDQARHPSTFHVLAQSTSANNPIPHTANCWYSSSSAEAMFALAYQTSLQLYIMNVSSGQTTSMELKQHNFVPRLLSNLTDAIRGKRNVHDSQFPTSLVFDAIGDQSFLYALYRDDQIRMWSTKSGQCITSVNCLNEGSEARLQGPQLNLLRKSSPTTLCAFLCHATGSEFVTLEVTCDGMLNYSLDRLMMIAAPEYDLVDFEINESRIWGLWCNSHGEFNISSHFLNATLTDGANWITAALEPPPDRYSIQLDRGIDPRQGYCSYIFHPGKFQKYVITKALTMFRRSDNLSDTKLSISILKDRVCQAVENEIQTELKDYDYTDEEFIDSSLRAWERFYSCCEQYHVKACEPIGLIQINSLSAVCVVKKNMFSLLRPCEPLEHLMLAGESAKAEDLTGTNLTENWTLCNDFVQLVSVLAYVEYHLSDDFKVEIDKKLYQMELPSLVVEKLLSEFGNEYDEGIFPDIVRTNINMKIHSINDLPAAMVLLLDSLRMDHGEPKSMQTHSKLAEFSRQFISIGNLFGSNYGISLLSESLRQTALVRYALCRNLLILQILLIKQYTLSSTSMEIIRSKCITETDVFVQAYYVMVWLCETPVNPTSTAVALESTMQRLNILQLTDSRYYVSRAQHSMSLLEMFLRGRGAKYSLALFADAQQNTSDVQWQFTLLPLVTIVGQLVWAVSGNFVFGEWLLSSCQHVLIQEYVRLLNSWCEWNNCSRHFILAVSLLDNGERDKSFSLFMRAARGVTSEQFLIEKILKSRDDIISPKEAIAKYYLRVIQLFEQYTALDCVIHIAQAAINRLDGDDPMLATFQSIVFANHLALQHYEEAYESLIHNAEQSRRKDCLRQLVVSLFEEKHLDILMQFPYIELQDELENIIESRARSMLVEDNNHYDFLYAFHITKGNMRKASSIMYERGMRYLRECDTTSAMQARHQCLVACLNALHLIEKNYAWIAKPVINDDNGDDEMEHENVSHIKRHYQEKVIVLEIIDVEKELLVCESVLLISKFNNELGSILKAGPSELVAILSNQGLYIAAVRLSIGFNLSITSVLESLAIACVNASDEDTEESMDWLFENVITDVSFSIDAVWNLLKDLIMKNEKEGSTELHKAVAQKLIQLGSFLPQWLYCSYKKIDASELLHLFVTNGRLIEATELAVEFIRAMIEGGVEYFGLRNKLESLSPPLCLPVQTLDLLLYGLKLNVNNDDTDGDAEYQECYNKLLKNVNRYLETAERVSECYQYGYKTIIDVR